MISRILAAIAALTLVPASAQAHTGHLAEAGQGHSHWLGYAILLGLVLWAGRALLRCRAADHIQGN
ncbi:MAG: DUF6732 family protein [Hyphomicrobiales bacterium]